MSGKRFVESRTPSLPPDRGKSEGKPPEKPFLPDVFEHPVFGWVRRTSNGGFIPWQLSDVFAGGSINLGGASGDGMTPLARSYATRRETPVPPPLSPLVREEIAAQPRGYKDDGRDVTGEALAGSYGQGRLTIVGSNASAESNDFSDPLSWAFWRKTPI